MDYLIQIDTISMPFLYFNGLPVKILKHMTYPTLMIGFTLANGADPDEMPHNQEFYCLTNYLFAGIQNEKG